MKHYINEVNGSEYVFLSVNDMSQLEYYLHEASGVYLSPVNFKLNEHYGRMPFVSLTDRQLREILANVGTGYALLDVTSWHSIGFVGVFSDVFDPFKKYKK